MFFWFTPDVLFTLKLFDGSVQASHPENCPYGRLFVVLNEKKLFPKLLPKNSKQ